MTTRSVTVEPGWDNRADGGGAHCDEWRYCVRSDDGEVALVLTVFSGQVNGCPSVEWARLGEYPYGAYVHLHAAWPASAEAALKEEPQDCKYLDRKCWIVGFGSLLADDLWAAANHAAREPQPDAFWAGLDERLAEWGAVVRRERDAVLPELSAAIERAREAFGEG